MGGVLKDLFGFIGGDTHLTSALEGPLYNKASEGLVTALLPKPKTSSAAPALASVAPTPLAKSGGGSGSAGPPGAVAISGSTAPNIYPWVKGAAPSGSASLPITAGSPLATDASQPSQSPT